MMKLKTQNNYFYLLIALVSLVIMPNAFADDDDDDNYSKHKRPSYEYPDYSNNRYNNGYRQRNDFVDIDIVNDYGRSFKEYSTRSNSYDVKRSYLQAKDGKSYAIRARNTSNERIGLVIAVDGRNIISGKKSYLKSKERMYILNPYRSATYKGWRSGKNRVNEFYFTDVPDSYADRTFADKSAMGVIAVAVFREKGGRWYRDDDYNDYSYRGKSGSKNAPKSRNKSAQKNHRGDYESDDAGTGYGNERYSPTRRVKFKAERRAAEKLFIKYEWKSTLCDKGIIRCGRHYGNRRNNRFWSRNDNYGYAPPPPSRRYKYYGQGIH